MILEDFKSYRNKYINPKKKKQPGRRVEGIDSQERLSTK
jgi:hypothetical protein